MAIHVKSLDQPDATDSYGDDGDDLRADRMVMAPPALAG